MPSISEAPRQGPVFGGYRWRNMATVNSPTVTELLGDASADPFLRDGTDDTRQGRALARRKKLFHLCDMLTFTREERHDLASMVLYRDVDTFSRDQLEDVEVLRLLDTIEGYLLVRALLDQRP